MMRLIKIHSHFFPHRYEEYTSFRASYGCVGLDDNGVTLFLDPRYEAAALANRELKIEPLANLPRQNCILDPWEWTIAEFQRFKFMDAVFESFQELSSEFVNLESDINDTLMQFSHEKKYLISNTINMTRPCLPCYVFAGQVHPLISENDVFFDPAITPVAYMAKLDLKNICLDPVRAGDAVISDISGYMHFLHKDAIAWMQFWQELEERGEKYTQVQAANLFFDMRSRQHGPGFENAFETIIGNNSSSSEIHGTPKDVALQPGIVLVDAGSLKEYRSDITRTFWLGHNAAANEIRKAYTSVLKAHIAVAVSEFDFATPVSYLDEIARRHVSFAHALGHGVGKRATHAYPALNGNSEACLGMILAIEPGVYYNGCFGVRLESLMRVKINERNKFALEYLTYIPFEYELIDFSDLSDLEWEWLCKFHKICHEKLLHHVDVSFLKKKTEKFSNSRVLN